MSVCGLVEGFLLLSFFFVSLLNVDEIYWPRVHGQGFSLRESWIENVKVRSRDMRALIMKERFSFFVFLN